MTSPSVHLAPQPRPPLLVVGVEQEWLARSLEAVLGPKGFAFVRGRSGRQTLDLATSVRPDIVLVDSRLSDLDGVEVCRRLRGVGGIRAHVPVVLITSGAVPRDFVREAYLAGAWSVWEQPFDGELLEIRLRTWIEAKRLVDAAELDRHMDAATSLYTYNGLQLRARELVSEAARRMTPVSCIAVGALAATDPDGPIGDRPLPTAADEAVRQTVTVLARTSDIVGEVSAGAFVILAPMTGAEGAATIIERLRERVAGLPTYHEGGEALRVTVRAGVSTFDTREIGFGDGSDLLQRAATALRFAHAERSAHAPTFAEVPATFI